MVVNGGDDIVEFEIVTIDAGNEAFVFNDFWVEIIVVVVVVVAVIFAEELELADEDKLVSIKVWLSIRSFIFLLVSLLFLADSFGCGGWLLLW